MTRVEMMQTMFNQLADQWKVPRFNVTSGAVEVDDGLPDDFFDGDEDHDQPNDGGDWHDRIMAEFHSNTMEALCGHLQDIPGVKEASVFADIDEPFVVEITVKCDEIANKRVIAESIYGHLPAGVATKGDISEIVAVPNGKWHDIRFNMTTEWSGGCGGSCESGGCADGGDCCSDEDESWLEDDGNSVLRCPQDCGNYKMLYDYCDHGNRMITRGETTMDRNPCCKFRRR